jgi:hypothetical protein
METQDIKITPEKEEPGKKSEKFAKAKKVVGKTAQFAGAAGLGVAGTMAANAINSTDSTEPGIDDAEILTPTEVEEVAISEAVDENQATDFDPNDIRIEDVDEVEIDQNNDEHLFAEIEPEPITGENQDDIIPDNPIVDNPEDFICGLPDIAGGPVPIDDLVDDITTDIISDDLI